MTTDEAKLQIEYRKDFATPAQIEALDMGLKALDEVERYKKALEEVERTIDSELLQWKFIDATEAKNAFAITLRSLSEYIKGVKS